MTPAGPIQIPENKNASVSQRRAQCCRLAVKFNKLSLRDYGDSGQSLKFYKTVKDPVLAPSFGTTGAVAEMIVTQTLASGLIIQQDFSNAVRPVFFQTDLEEWQYATHGGTLFIVQFRG
jgi:hypothetical protein